MLRPSHPWLTTRPRRPPRTRETMRETRTAPGAGRRGAPPAPPPPPDAHTCAHSTEQGQEPEAKREVMNENSGEREPRHGADYTKRRKSQLQEVAAGRVPRQLRSYFLE